MSDRDRKEALVRVICCRLPALTLEQIEEVDRKTTSMIIEAIDPEDTQECAR